MEDLGAPASFVTLEPGAPVYASDGEEVGRVAEVRADDTADIFDGLVVERGLLGFERGVVLTVDSSAVERLPEEPS